MKITLKVVTTILIILASTNTAFAFGDAFNNYRDRNSDILDEQLEDQDYLYRDPFKYERERDASRRQYEYEQGIEDRLREKEVEEWNRSTQEQIDNLFDND